MGEVTGGYYFNPEGPLPHRRPVNWLPHAIRRGDLSPSLRASLGFAGTVCDLSQHAIEIESLLSLGANSGPPAADAVVLVLESVLEDFLVSSWESTSLGKDYEIVTVNGELVGRQYPTGTGPMDIVPIIRDGSE